MKNHYERKEIIKITLILSFVAISSIVLGKLGEDNLSSLMKAVDDAGNIAPVLFILCNAVGIVLVIPQTLFTIAAGLVFGTVKGTALSLMGMALGSSVAFFAGRLMLRDRLIRRFSGTRYFTKLEKLSENHPFKILALSRIVPILPYPVVNYIWSVTSVHFLPFIAMSLICIIPETFFLTAGGHILQTGITQRMVNWPIIVILVIAGSILLYLVSKMRSILD